MARRAGFVALGLALLAAAGHARGCRRAVSSTADAPTPPRPSAWEDGDVATTQSTGGAPVRRGLPRVGPRPPLPSRSIDAPLVTAGQAKQAWQQAIAQDIGDHLTVFIEECHELAAVDRREDGDLSIVLQLVGEPSEGVTVVDVEVRMTSTNEALRECITASAVDVQVSTATPPHAYEDRFELSVTTREGRRAYTWSGEPIRFD